ncbi:MAG: hypothetical protein ABJF10_20245 [Chthoniobacter sp.]|uniref:hypothetical protein n=1 Tax=Chthoniobacter sp. TaxID=2510640 RepID=UPI0032ABB3F9
MNRRLLIIGLLLSVLSFAQAEPKAYDLVKYRGKAATVTIAFDFADGYPQASEIKITDGKKTTTFRLDGSGEMKFAPEKAGGAIKSVALKMGMDDSAPAKVSGSYLAGGKSVPFTLAKSGK